MDKEELKAKIEKTIKEVSFLRGLVITKFVDVEGMIGAIINNYFTLSNRQTDFSSMALSDPYFSFGLKRNILFKIIRKIEWKSFEGFKEELDRLNRIRNRFAHAVLFGFDGHLIYDKGEKPMEIKQAKEMFDEFIPLWSKVFEELDRIFLKIIGKAKPTI